VLPELKQTGPKLKKKKKLVFLYTIALIHSDRRKDMAKLIGAFCDYVSAPKNSSYSFFQSDVNLVATESEI
jgi:hypothetical protein